MILRKDARGVNELTHDEVRPFDRSIYPDRIYVWDVKLFIPLNGVVLVEAMWGTRDNAPKVRLFDRIKGLWQ